jgi:hypothetical protein
MTPRDLGSAKTVDELKGFVKKAAVENPESLLLFRGQTDLYETIRSGQARGQTQP